MTGLAAFGIALGAAAILTATVIALLWRPLGSTVQELCGGRERGEFWAVFSAVALAAGGLLVGLLGYWIGQAGPEGASSSVSRAQPFWSGVQLLRWTGIGLLVGVGALSVGLAAFHQRLPRHVGETAMLPPGA